MASKINLQETIVELAGQGEFDISPCPSMKSELLVYKNGELVQFSKYSLNTTDYKVNFTPDLASTILVGDCISFATIINYSDGIIADDTVDVIFANGFTGSQIREKTITNKNIADGTINANNVDIYNPNVGLVTRLIPGTGVKIVSPPGVPTGNGVCKIEVTISENIDMLTEQVIMIDQATDQLSADLFTNSITIQGVKTFSNKLVLGPEGIQFHTDKIAGQFYTSDIAPTNIDLLNFDGYFRATRVFTDKIMTSLGVNFPVVKTPGQFYTGDLTAPSNMGLTQFDGHIKATKLTGLTVEGGVFIFPTAKAAGQFYTQAVEPTNTNMLYYDGYLKATRVYNAVYNDIAEGMPSDGTLEPGDFAMIDISHPTFRLTKYIHTVENMALYMGIVSENPGFVVGDNPQYEHQVYLILKGMIDIPFHKIGQSFDVENFSVGDDLIIARDRSYQKIIGKIIEINKIKNTIKVFI